MVCKWSNLNEASVVSPKLLHNYLSLVATFNPREYKSGMEGGEGNRTFINDKKLTR